MENRIFAIFEIDIILAKTKHVIVENFIKIFQMSKIDYRTFEKMSLERCKGFESCRSRKMLQNAYLDAKIGVDTEENES